LSSSAETPPSPHIPRATQSPGRTEQYIDTPLPVTGTEVRNPETSIFRSENPATATTLTDAEPDDASKGTISMTLIIIIAVVAVVVVVIVVGLIIYFVRRKRDREKIEDGETRQQTPKSLMREKELQYGKVDESEVLPENELPC
jgi:flagellar biosynthesis/type III secretory pathway M-ring protein FliF/YscJ